MLKGSAGCDVARKALLPNMTMQIVMMVSMRTVMLLIWWENVDGGS